MKTIDMTPTWPEVLNLCLALLESPSAESRKTGRGTLKQMAELAESVRLKQKAAKDLDDKVALALSVYSPEEQVTALLSFMPDDAKRAYLDAAGEYMA